MVFLDDTRIDRTRRGLKIHRGRHCLNRPALRVNRSDQVRERGFLRRRTNNERGNSYGSFHRAARERESKRQKPTSSSLSGEKQTFQILLQSNKRSGRVSITVSSYLRFA